MSIEPEDDAAAADEPAASPRERSGQRQMLSLMTARVSDAYVRPALYLDGALDLVAVCRRLADANQTCALVRDEGRTGIFTTTDLRDALLAGRAPERIAVRDAAHFDMVTVDAQAALFEALRLMIRHRVHRLVVESDGAIVGVLGQLDLMGFVSNHSHLIALQIAQAAGVDELEAASRRVSDLVDLLWAGGSRVEAISALVGELNVQLYARLWSLLAPPELVANSCLLVMGSEGRGEQILKTDQDNALLLRNGFEFAGLDALAQRFGDALIAFGWPPCPGGIMLSNPVWRKPLSEFEDQITGWLHSPDVEGPIRLSIFLDAAPVAGDAALLRAAKAHLYDMLSGDDVFLARFARAADQFQEPGWWSRLSGRLHHDEPAFDLKKLGTFPIVHGVRALALQRRIDALATTERLRALVDAQTLSAHMARDLGDALHFFIALRLENDLRRRRAGEPSSNVVRLSQLATLQGDRLKDALGIIRQFRQFLARHFRFDAF